jgi:sporulation protein YlmC with PRC-barrel domain
MIMVVDAGFPPAGIDFPEPPRQPDVVQASPQRAKPDLRRDPMKHLLMTTALVAATSFGAFAQTAPATTDPMAPAITAPAGQAHAAHVPAFLATSFTGMTLYTLDSEAVRAVRTQDGMTRWNSGDAFLAERERWESVGSIADVVMTQDGAVQGILIDVGGFLGFFARTVMIDIDDLYFVADDATPEDLSDFFVVASMTREQLENLPEWSDDALTTGFAPRQVGMDATPRPVDGGMADATTSGTAVPPAATVSPDPSTAALEGRAGAPGAPAPAPEGYAVVDGALPSADQLVGASVYDAVGDSVGNVNDLTLNGDAEVVEVLVDVGGFLGIGSHTVALPVENVDILWNASTDSVRVHLPMTRDMIESLPEHQG